MLCILCVFVLSVLGTLWGFNMCVCLCATLCVVCAIFDVMHGHVCGYASV